MPRVQSFTSIFADDSGVRRDDVAISITNSHGNTLHIAGDNPFLGFDGRIAAFAASFTPDDCGVRSGSIHLRCSASARWACEPTVRFRCGR